MTDAIINFFDKTLNNDILTIIVIAIIPIIELRGSIPVAIAMGMPVWQAYLWAWLGSSLVCPILLLILRPVLDWMKKTKWFRSLALAVESTFRSKADKVVKESERDDPKKTKKKMLGVYAFVAVPLPLTGVWSGSAVAAFLNMSFGKALISVLLGNLTAGAIVTLLAYFLADYMDYILTGFLIIVLLVLAFYIVMVFLKIRKNKKADKAESEKSKALCEAAETDAKEETDGAAADKIADEKAVGSDEAKVSLAEKSIKTGIEKEAEEPPERVAKPSEKTEINNKN